MNIVTDSTGLIVVVSTGRPEPPQGGALYTLTDEQEVALDAAFAQPNSGVKFDGESFTVLPAPPLPKPRAVCSAWQFRKECRVRGIKAAVDALIAAQDDEVQEAFEYATEYWSDNPMLLALAAQLPTPLAEEQVYEMIVSASTRVVGVP